MAMTAEKFVTEIEGMTVLELNTLVKALEEKFGVSAAAMASLMVVAAGWPGVGGFVDVDAAAQELAGVDGVA